MNEHPDIRGNPGTPELEYTRADLDGNGQFEYIVAGYNDGFVATLRVFRLADAQITLVGDMETEGHPDVSGGNLSIELIDVDNDGKPEITVESSGMSAGYSLSVFKWTGHSLRLMNIDHSQFGNAFGDADLWNPDGNGVLDIVTPSSSSMEQTDPNNPPPPGEPSSPYMVYKLKNGQYQLAFTSITDPTGAIGPNNEDWEVFAGRALLRPNRFSLKQIERARSEHDPSEVEDGVVVRLGNLWEGDNRTRVDTGNLDLKSLILGRNIHALSTRIRSADEDSSGDDVERANDEAGQSRRTPFLGSFVEARFSREALLEYLPKVRFDSPLAPGDTLSLEVNGKMKNGVAMVAFVAVHISSDKDKDKDKDK